MFTNQEKNRILRKFTKYEIIYVPSLFLKWLTLLVIEYKYEDTTRDYHTKWSKSEKTNTIWYHLYVKSEIWHRWTYLWNRNRLTDTENRYGCQGVARWGRDGLGV